MSARRVLLLIVAALTMPGISVAADRPRIQRDAHVCLSYEPAVVTLTGRLERRTYPGRPNYESIKEGDEPETHFYLNLPRSICTNGERDSPDTYPQQNVKLIQLVLELEGYKRLRPMLGRTVTVTGRLFARHTAHHHAPLLLNKVQLASGDR